jgi:hypothetical protein
VLVAAGLITSAVIHFQLAPGYQQAAPGGIGQGNLFRIQASVAILSALYVLAMILYRYVQLPAIGPIPSMYEPVWFTEKVVTAVVEGIAGVLAIAGYILLSRSGKAKAGSAAPASAR